eukprot:369561-Rhodomonas_salina.1
MVKTVVTAGRSGARPGDGQRSVGDDGDEARADAVVVSAGTAGGKGERRCARLVPHDRDRLDALRRRDPLREQEQHRSCRCDHVSVGHMHRHLGVSRRACVQTDGEGRHAGLLLQVQRLRRQHEPRHHFSDQVVLCGHASIVSLARRRQRDPRRTHHAEVADGNLERAPLPRRYRDEVGDGCEVRHGGRSCDVDRLGGLVVEGEVKEERGAFLHGGAVHALDVGLEAWLDHHFDGARGAAEPDPGVVALGVSDRKVDVGRARHAVPQLVALHAPVRDPDVLLRGRARGHQHGLRDRHDLLAERVEQHVCSELGHHRHLDLGLLVRRRVRPEPDHHLAGVLLEHHRLRRDVEAG